MTDSERFFASASSPRLPALGQVRRIARRLRQRIQVTPRLVPRHGEAPGGEFHRIRQRPAADARRAAGPWRCTLSIAMVPAPCRRHAASARRHGHCRRRPTAVSACTRRKRSRGRPSRSAAICGKLVSCPWPFDCVPRRAPPCRPRRSAPPPIPAARRARSPGSRLCRARAACPAPRSRAARAAKAARSASRAPVHRDCRRSGRYPSASRWRCDRGSARITLRRRNSTGSMPSRRAAASTRRSVR